MARWKKIVLIGAGVLIVVAGAAVATRYLIAGNAQEVSAAEPVLASGPLYSVAEIVTNLADEHRRCFIQIKIELEVDSSAVVRELAAREAPVTDRILAVLRSKTSDDLAGERGMRAVGDEIIEQLNGLLVKGCVNNIFFTKFIVQ